DLMMDWGHGPAGHTGGNIAAGTWAKGAAKRMVMPRVADGTLGIDLAASNAYAGGGEALSRITAKTTVIVSQRDRMTAPKNGLAVAEGIEGARVITLQDIGHFAHGEAPNDSLGAIKAAVC
uniref:alpha/beta fold hydrolase n=1 Tax=Salipiger bermudensis TaxID=344736 RepID=UPI0035183D03